MYCIVCAKFKRPPVPACRISVNKFCVFFKHFAATRTPYFRYIRGMFFVCLYVFSCVDSICMLRVEKYRVNSGMLKTGFFGRKLDFFTKNPGFGPFLAKSHMRHSGGPNAKYKVSMRFLFEIRENRICLECLHQLSAYASRMSDIVIISELHTASSILVSCIVYNACLISGKSPIFAEN